MSLPADMGLRLSELSSIDGGSIGREDRSVKFVCRGTGKDLLHHICPSIVANLV